MKRIGDFVRICMMTGAVIAVAGCNSNPTPVENLPEPEALVSQNVDMPTNDSSAKSEDVVHLTIPVEITDKKSKKSEQYEEILDLLEIGSLHALTEVGIRAAQFRRSAELPADVQDLLVTVGYVMSLVYPLEPWTPFEKSGTPSNYLAAAESAKNGVYDYNAGTDDMLEKIIPSLVLLVSPRDVYFQDAATALDSGIKDNPRSVLALYLRGILYVLQGDNSKACDLFLRAEKLDDTCYPVSVELVKLGLNGVATAGDYMARAELLVSRYPDALQMLELQARAAFARKDWQKADSYVSRVLQRTPDNAEFLLMRARILIEKKDFLKANSLLDAYGKIDRYEKTYLLLRARLHREWNRNMRAAAATISEAYARYPSDLDVLLDAAEICLNGGNSISGKKCSDFVATALSVNPENIRARVLLMLDARKKEDWQNVIKAGRPLLETEERAVVLLPVCEAFNKTQNSEQSLVLLNPLAETSKNDATFMEVYLESLIVSGDSDTAGRIITEKMSNASPSLKSVFFYYKNALNQNTSGVSDETLLSDLRSSLLSNPRNFKSLMAMYRFYYARQDYRKSMYYLKQAIALDVGNDSLIKKQRELETLIK